MKRYLYIFAFLLICAISWAQIYKPILFPEKVDKKYIIHPLADEEKFRKKVSGKIPRKHVKPFTYACAFKKAEMFKEGEIYLNWTNLEAYLNQVLDSIIPGNLRTKKIKVFIGRSSELNAFCMYDGTMVVNVGLFGEVKNEAALATVMGHELAHFIKNHVLNEYVASVKQKRQKNQDELELAIKNKGYSQQLEMEADELGYAIAKDGGYDVHEAISNFELFIREKEYYKKRMGSELVNDDSVKVKTKAGELTANSLEKLLSTHPDEKERKEKLQTYLKNNPHIKKSIYKIDENFFKALQKQARLESVNLVFNEHNYTECLERAFRYHLFEPNELTYSYFVAECIRRLCLMDYTLRKKGFLTDKTISSSFNNGQGILRDLHFLVPNEEEYKKIKATELTSSTNVPFDTYKEAFYYFNEKLIKAKYSEAHLMTALFENNADKRRKSIEKYLAQPSALRKEYAKNYLDNTLVSKINGNSGEIVLIPQVGYYSHTRYNKFGSYGRLRYNFGKSEITGTKLANNLSEGFNSRLDNTKSISLPKASTENFNTKVKYVEMITSSFLAQREENEGYDVVHYYKELDNEDYIGKIDIFRLNPEIWDFFVANNINTITYARYSRHYSEADAVLKRPSLYFGIPTFGLSWLFLPARIANYKRLDVYSYDSNAEQVLFFYNIKGYWLTPKKAIRMYRKLKKEKAEFIRDNYSNT